MIKTIFKSIIKNKLISLFLIIEFSITIFLSLDAIETYEIINTKRKTMNSMFDTKNTLMIQESVIDQSSYNNNSKEYTSVIDNLKSINGIEKVGYYSTQDTNGDVRSTLGGIKKYVFVNDDMLDILKLKDRNNNIITNKAFGENSVFVISGSDLNLNGKSFEISGGYSWKKTYGSNVTLKKGSLFPADFQIIENAPVDLNKGIIIKLENNKFMNNMIKPMAVNGFTLVKFKNTDVTKLKSSINKKFDEAGIKVNLKNMEDYLNEYIEKKEVFFISRLRVTICLAAFSVVGTILTLFLSVNRRKREFGIRMSAGASKFYLLRLVFGETFMLVFISYIFAVIYYGYKNNYVLEDLSLNVYEAFSPLFTIKYLLIAFLLIILFSFSVIRSILKIQPRDLIGGIK